VRGESGLSVLTHNPLSKQNGQMGKYDALCDHLRRQSRRTLEMTFDEISDLVPGGLPPSAYNHIEFWANTRGSHIQANSWQDAGFRTRSTNMTARRVTFVRIGP
jgi:hypothetical protein